MHNIIEKMEGNDMRDFIQKNKRAADINQVRDIGK